jgi:hypothetical protein
MQERHERVTVAFEERDERRRRPRARRSPPVPHVAGGRPAEKLRADDETRFAVVEDERAVGQFVEASGAMGGQSLAVER